MTLRLHSALIVYGFDRSLRIFADHPRRSVAICQIRVPRTFEELCRQSGKIYATAREC
jgi:hypothetical protein